MRNVGEEQVDVARVDAARHPELDRAGGLSRPAIDSISRCMSDAAPKARSGCRSPWNSSSRASPRNLRTSPPWRSATWIKPSNTAEIVSTSSSAPSRPRAARRSDSAVKPDTSAETSDPSSARRRDDAGPSLHRRTSRGRYGARSASRARKCPWKRLMNESRLCPLHQRPRPRMVQPRRTEGGQLAAHDSCGGVRRQSFSWLRFRMPSPRPSP